MEAKLNEMMQEFCQSKSDMLEEFHQSKSDMEKRFADSMNELKREMSAAQERTSQQLTKRIGSSTYQFRRKGNEHQLILTVVWKMPLFQPGQS